MRDLTIFNDFLLTADLPLDQHQCHTVLDEHNSADAKVKPSTKIEDKCCQQAFESCEASCRTSCALRTHYVSLPAWTLKPSQATDQCVGVIHTGSCLGNGPSPAHRLSGLFHNSSPSVKSDSLAILRRLYSSARASFRL